ncbi:RNA polymerase sigma factor [Clostridium aceticum]|uniref:RNA polymerase sigma factor n=1 Tax=Clostridium aceticum TaxID=84022 RepID=UPI000AB1681B|nr:sigma-70 family RNA polymerase sigma factor [Clostridium aceticum]
MQHQEDVLIEKARRGDIESFELLIEAYQKKAFNIAYRILGNLEDANDVTQEALVKVYRSIHNFKGNSSFSTWLYSIVNNVCIDFIRKIKKQSFFILMANKNKELIQKNYQMK